MQRNRTRLVVEQKVDLKMEKASKTEMVRRTVIFLVGLALNSLGVALVTKASLGTSPISTAFANSGVAFVRLFD